MDKIFLKPTSREISIRGKSKEGRTDVFAYDYYNDEDKRKLGGLYMIGNVKQDNAENTENYPDIAYITNLVASLAKREYYSKPDASPRDAFLTTLKKINDVVEEFFRNKSLKVNIGIFAIAGNDIMISKFGKFKIILGRPARAGGESRAIDILNNVDLFNKEQGEDKEFSNIVSGKVAAGDKIFAFFPNRIITAREKTIRADLLKSDTEQFLEKINSVKELKPDFDCGALHISLNHHKESTIVKKPKVATPETPPTGDVSINLAKTDIKELKPVMKEKDHTSDIIPETPEPAAEIPKIISSEFSLGKKTNPLMLPVLAGVKIAKGLYGRNFNLKSKFIILSFAVGVLAISAILLRIFVITDTEQRRLNLAINQVQNNLNLIQTKINQNDLIGARQMLIDSLSSIYETNIKSDRTQKTADEIYAILDKIDKAVDVSPTLIETMPEELNKRIGIFGAHKDLGIALDIYENNLYILTKDNILKITDIDNNAKKEPSVWLKSGDLPPQPTMLTVDGNIYVMNSSGALTAYNQGKKISDTDTFIVSGEKDTLLTSKDSDKLYVTNKTLARIYELDKKSGSLIKTLKVGSSEPFVEAYLYGDGVIIIITKDGRIWEIK